MYEKYIVKKGDTLTSIGLLFEKTPQTIADENEISLNDILKEGMILKIEKQSPPAFEYYEVKKGDTLYEVSKRFNISMKVLEEINGLEPNEYLYVGQTLVVPKEGVLAYITKPGDTLISISEKYGIPENEILLYNKKIFLLENQLIAFKLN